MHVSLKKMINASTQLMADCPVRETQYSLTGRIVTIIDGYGHERRLVCASWNSPRLLLDLLRDCQQLEARRRCGLRLVAVTTVVGAWRRQASGSDAHLRIGKEHREEEA